MHQNSSLQVLGAKEFYGSEYSQKLSGSRKQRKEAIKTLKSGDTRKRKINEKHKDLMSVNC